MQIVTALLLVIYLPTKSKTKTLITPTAPEDTEDIVFQVSDCSGVTGDKLNIMSYSGGAPASCQNIKIYEEPTPSPAQIISLPPEHPVKFAHCKVYIKAFTGT